MPDAAAILIPTEVFRHPGPVAGHAQFSTEEQRQLSRLYRHHTNAGELFETAASSELQDRVAAQNPLAVGIARNETVGPRRDRAEGQGAAAVRVG